MEVISIERSTYEELLTSFNSFVTKMKEMASRGNEKGFGDWLDNQGVCLIQFSEGISVPLSALFYQPCYLHRQHKVAIY